MEEKEIKTAAENTKEEQLEGVSGGSWKVPESTGKAAGLSLRKENGAPGEWGYLWNTGDYYWRGKKVDDFEAYAIVKFYVDHGREPWDIKEAVRHYKKTLKTVQVTNDD